VRQCLERIAAHDPALHCFLSVAEKAALEQARAAEKRLLAGESRGPLDGLPIALKDLIDVEGQVTSAGLRDPYRINAREDAHVVRRLRRAGMVLLGKLNLHEAALGGTTDNPHHGRTHNPWNPEHTPGGSSGGSGAAVAADLVPAALGSDTLGSVRIPAAYCGVSGLKPTSGRISLRGVTPLSWSLDTVGPLAHDVEDLALLVDALTDYDPRDPQSRASPDATALSPLPEPEQDGISLAVIEDWEGNDTDPAVSQAFEAALAVMAGAGCSIKRVKVEGIRLARYFGLLIIEADAARVHRELLSSEPDAVGGDVRMALAYGADMKAGKLAEAWEYRTLLAHKMGQLFKEADAVASPAVPQAAFPFSQETPSSQALFTAPANLCGLPALSLPMGFDGTGLPLGLQLTGRAWGERRLLELGRLFQAHTSWHKRRPPPAFPDHMERIRL